MDDSTVQVTTVRGPVPVASLGMTLTHEHLLCDWSARPRPEPEDPAERALFHAQVSPELQWVLREDPRCCRDNARQDDPEATVAELENFVAAGGRTVVDCTNGDIGRDPLALRAVAERTGLNVIMGSGWYVHLFHAARRALTTVDDLVAEIVAEFADGVGDTGIRPGIIGEIGVSPQFTDAERTHLRAAARAQRELAVPLFVHLPGWQRRAHEVLDIVLDEEGVRPEAVVLCHMDPSGEDPDYQRAVAARGVWLEFDMIGMPFLYAGEGQCPAPHQTAAAVAALVAAGHTDQLLLSHDMATKAMWTRNGGNGYGYVPRFFLPRLQRLGVPGEVAAGLLTANPRRLFTAAGHR
ncbi:phosphotriesterase family protein [Pseudonocardia oroxyli]|uniref:Phosphotriesterase-related protein n=1 Tax=Pseudonocardia oroxyli TaxID=366584 RepID=A0A1G7PZM6_PSEOR|nr:aryldialkylphosphatase [Pseudonocardia oroxyli]SDF91119.1 phosphotriesterase-related protein [Pseudonocardia oroxyli]